MVKEWTWSGSGERRGEGLVLSERSSFDGQTSSYQYNFLREKVFNDSLRTYPTVNDVGCIWCAPGAVRAVSPKSPARIRSK